MKKNRLKNILSYILEYVLSCRKQKTKKLHNRVVIVRIDGIGDFTVWSDSARYYKKIFKNKEIVLVCDKKVISIARFFDCFDRVDSIDFDRLLTFDIRYIFRLRKTMKELKCDVLINPMSIRGTAKNFVAASIPANYKVAIKGWRVRKSTTLQDSIIYDEIVAVNPENCTEFQRNALFVRGLGYKAYKSGFEYIPDMPSKIDIKEPYCVIQIGASTTNRCISAYKVREVIKYICIEKKITCCIIGTDVELAEEIIKGSIFENLNNFVGKTDLADIVYLIRHCCFFIGHDTSGIHFAMASHVPAIAISGGWHYGKFLPYDADNKDLNDKLHMVIYKTDCIRCYYEFTKECKKCVSEHGCYLCIHRIKVEDIIEEIDGLYINCKTKKMAGSKE